ncbi:MAG: hypothetical protein LW698_04495 [Planctomycetaceae bacterium]|nr:hypothetical protein [Planctomycetaceae bacterium]
MSTHNEPGGTVVHEIRWSDALPWWLIFRAAGAAFSPTVILLAAAGAVATWAGWSMADRLGLAGVDRAADVIAAAKAADELLLPAAAPVTTLAAGGPATWLPAVVDRLPPVVADMTRLLAIPFRPSATLREVAGAAARIGWFVLVWSIFGTAISRHVALKLVGEDTPGIVGATWFGSRKWLPAFNAVLFVLVGIFALSVPGAVLGLAMRTEWGLAFAGAVWPLVLLGAVVLAILAVGMIAGWPLMVACVGVERGDSFQAISTAFSYLYQRPLHYAFYAIVALLVSIPTLLVAGLFAHATADLAMWATSFGMGHERTATVLDGLAAGGPAAAAWGVKAIGFWTRGLETLLSSFGWGYFWAIATAAYLLLRQDVDGTELDEVVLEEPAGDAT